MGSKTWWWADPGKALRGALALGLATLAMACAPGDERLLSDDDGPGQAAAEGELTCTSDADCDQGELCEAGHCRLSRCNDEYASGAPLGTTHFLKDEDEIAVISDDSYLDGFESTDGSYVGSLEGSGAIADVVDGNFDGSVPRGVAIAYQNVWDVELMLGSGSATLALSFLPRALAAGDVDGDGLDELIAVGDEMVSACHVDTLQCDEATISGAVAIDLAAADVDADGFAEALLLLQASDGAHVMLWNADAAITQQTESQDFPLSVSPMAIAAGALTGDGTPEVVLLEDGGWLGFSSDRLHVMSAASGAVEQTFDVDSDALDIAAGDRDGDGRDELALLRSDRKIDLFKLDSSLTSWIVVDVTVGETLQRIAMFDWDGNAPAGTLLEGPVLVTGAIVPTMAVAYPPYPEGYASGVPGLWVGDSKDIAVSASRTVSLQLGVSLGVGIETPILEASVAASLSSGIEFKTEYTHTLNIGKYFFLDADPSSRRDQSGAVVVSCGCYHRYRYSTVDPSAMIGGSDVLFEVLVPVGGQTQMWSTARYNAMARELGTMPEINIPYRIGDMASYPQAPTGLDGQPIPVSELLFPEPPSFHASEIAETEFLLSAGDTTTNETVETIEIGTEATFGAGIVELELSASIGLSQGYSISVGSEALFAGWVPPVPDNPSTPEDEALIHSYAFTPYIYRQHYVDAAGQAAAFYAMTYTTSQTNE